jgi:hypothetical protein
MSARIKSLDEERALRSRAAEPLMLSDVDELAAAMAAAPDLDDREAENQAAPGEDLAFPEDAPPILRQWARFRAQFAEAMADGLYRVEDLEADIFAGRAYLWPGKAAALVAQKMDYPSGESVLQVLWAVGDVDELLAMAPGVEATGRLLGCSSMLIEGRAGWARVLKRHGYEPWSVTVRKAL